MITVNSRVGIVSLGSGGTMGHLSLAKMLLDELGTINSIVFADEDYSELLSRKVHFKKVKRSRHVDSVGGQIEYTHREMLSRLLRTASVTHVFFSTFYDVNLIKALREQGMKCYLFTYSLRSPNKKIIFSRGNHRYFNRIFMLRDLCNEGKVFDNEVLITPRLKDSEIRTSNEVKRILISVGGGGRPSSKQFCRIIEEVFSKILEKYSNLKIRFFYGKAKIVKRIEGVEYIPWTNEFLREVSKSDIVVSEAGYYTLLDLLSCSKPALLIPGKRWIDNQELRSVEFELLGLGKFILPFERPEVLFRTLIGYIEHPELLKTNQSNFCGIRKRFEASNMSTELKKILE